MIEIDPAFAVGMAIILFLVGAYVSVVRKKWGAVMLIAAGMLWLWGLRGENGVYSLLGWLGAFVSIGGLLVYIEDVKQDILKAIENASTTTTELTDTESGKREKGA